MVTLCTPFWCFPPSHLLWWARLICSFCRVCLAMRNGDKSHLIFMTYLSDEKCQIAGALVLPLFRSYSQDECSTVAQGVSVEPTSYLSQRPANGQVSSNLTNCEIVKWLPFSSDKYFFDYLKSSRKLLASNMDLLLVLLKLFSLDFRNDVHFFYDSAM